MSQAATGMQIEIQQFELRHLERVLSIEQASFASEAWDKDLFLEYSRECPSFFLIAKLGRGIAGYMIACATAKNAELVSIAVDPRFRHRGLANAMLHYTLARLRRRGIRTWWLMVRTTNTAAIGFYEGFGFTRTRMVKRYYENRGDAWRMRLSISHTLGGYED